jgi:hypothetical protein
MGPFFIQIFLNEHEKNMAKMFIKNNHLIDFDKTLNVNMINLGLFKNDKIVAVLSFEIKNNVCKIIKFCCLMEIDFNLAFSKLMSCVESEHLKKDCLLMQCIIDARYETAEHLLKNNFYFVEEKIDWKWTNGRKITNKETKQKITNKSNWYKIYDAGQKLYAKNIRIKHEK